MAEPINNFTGYASEKESIEFLLEGLRQAASYARQLAKEQNHPIWEDICMLLTEMHNTCLKLSQSKSLGRQKTLQILDQRENAMSKKLDGARTPERPKFLMN